MNLKIKIAALSALLILQNFGAVNAAAIDDELAVFAAEQDKTGEQVEPFKPNSADGDKNKPKTRDEIKAEEKRLEQEREEARQKIKDERKKSRDELKGKTPISRNPAPPVRTPEINTVETTPPVEPVEEVKPVQAAVSPQTVNLPNPVKIYSTFNEIVQDMGFTPLYIPKKFGYDVTAIMSIDNRVAEVRYNRKWEPKVSLHVRTYRRGESEELKDISGVHGVKWRVNVASGITTYIAKIDENKHVAAWAVGGYTFSAYAENLSFAAFHSLVVDELVDLTNHYYLGI